MNSSYSLIDIRPLSGAIGAEIHGVDLNKVISKEQFLEVKSAFGQYGVIFLEIKIYLQKKKLLLQKIGEKLI
jgi:taurine dioxygenase